MFKLVLEKAEEPEIKLPTSTGSSKKQENSRKTSIALLTMPKPLTVWITINCGKFWKRWEYQTTWPASWETYMQIRKQQLEVDMEQQTGSKLGKEYIKAVYCHPASLTYMQSTSWETLGWMKHKLETRLPGEISIRYADDTTLMAESEEELKSLLMKVKVESEKVVLKLNVQKTKIMASSPITLWQIDEETVETVSDFIFLQSRITADGDCSHEIKRHLLLGRKVMTNLDSILKSRDITLPAKICLVKAMVFPVVMYGCESWTIKKAEHQGIDAFELWCWRRLLRVPWTARRSNQSILKEISPECSLSWVFIGRTAVEAETPILWPPDVKNWLIRKDHDAGKDWRWEEKGSTEDEMVVWHHRLNGHEFGWTPGVGDGQGGLACCSPWGRKESDTTEQLNWTGTGEDWKQDVKGMRGDGWIASLTQWTGVWTSSAR